MIFKVITNNLKTFGIVVSLVFFAIDYAVVDGPSNKEVLKNLKDIVRAKYSHPNEATFNNSHLYYAKDTPVLCGEVSMGGQSKKFHRFIAVDSNDLNATQKNKMLGVTRNVLIVSDLGYSIFQKKWDKICK